MSSLPVAAHHSFRGGVRRDETGRRHRCVHGSPSRQSSLVVRGGRHRCRGQGRDVAVRRQHALVADSQRLQAGHAEGRRQGDGQGIARERYDPECGAAREIVTADGRSFIVGPAETNRRREDGGQMTRTMCALARDVHVAGGSGGARPVDGAAGGGSNLHRTIRGEAAGSGRHLPGRCRGPLTVVPTSPGSGGSGDLPVQDAPRRHGGRAERDAPRPGIVSEPVQPGGDGEVDDR